jgi:hypothetical protein
MAVNRLQRYWPESERAEPKERPSIRGLAPQEAEELSWTDAVGKVLGEYPRTTVVIALSVGVFLGWLIKRH